MTTPLTGPGSATPAPLTENERLRKVARDLEGVFVEQMFRAMRETVPDGGVVDGGTGEEMFTTLLDQKLSAEAPARWDRGLADAVYRQLRGRIEGVGSGMSEVGGAQDRVPQPDARPLDATTSDLRLPTSDSPPTSDLRPPTPPSSTSPSSPILTSDKRPEQS